MEEETTHIASALSGGFAPTLVLRRVEMPENTGDFEWLGVRDGIRNYLVTKRRDHPLPATYSQSDASEPAE